MGMTKIMKGFDEGIPFDSLSRLRSRVAIAKSETKAREQEKLRKAEEAKKAEESAAKKAVVQKELDVVVELIKDAEAAAKKANESVKPLVAKDSVQLPASKIEDAATIGKTEASSGKELIKQANEKLKAMLEPAFDLDEELKGFQKRESTKLKSKANQLSAQLEKAFKTASDSKEKAARKAYSESKAFDSRW